MPNASLIGHAKIHNIRKIIKNMRFFAKIFA